MAVFNKFNSFTTNLGKDINLSSDTLGVVLTNTLPLATNELLADITEITAENGYAAGGPDVAITSWQYTDVPGVAELVNASPTITAAGGTIGPFQYAVLYDKTPVGGPLMGWFDYGSAITLQDGESLNVVFDDGTGSGTLTVGP